MNILPNELIEKIYEYYNPYKNTYNNLLINNMKIYKEKKQIKARYNLCIYELNNRISATLYNIYDTHIRILKHIKMTKKYDDDDDYYHPYYYDPYQDWIDSYKFYIQEKTDSKKAKEIINDFLENLQYSFYP